ncbi:MAG: hypothetical protein J6W95_04305 [Bacteroidales bacterium]|nr:hypothetical protein [Bacteroidales bacterium]
MKKMMILALLMTTAITASAMNYSTARNEALFLSDKMAYELNLTDAQYDAVYEINLDYLMSVGTRDDAYGSWWNRRNADLRYVLTPHQYDRFVRLTHFYRPLTWHNGTWTFGVYNVYRHDRFYRSRPSGIASYRGGNNRRPDHYAHHRQEPGRPTGNTWRHNDRPAGVHGHPTTHGDRRHHGR